MAGRPKAGSRRSAMIPPAPEGVPVKPAWVRDEPSRSLEWDELCGHISSSGVSSPVFAPTLEAICKRSKIIETLEALVAEHGELLSTDKGTLYANPALSQLKVHLAAREKLLLELGLSPCSSNKAKRTKPKDDGQGDGLAKLLKVKVTG